MKMQRWKVIAISLIVAGIASAAWGQAWRPFTFGFGAGGGSVSASSGQFLLLADGTNKVLLVNGVAKICLAATC